MSDFDKLAAARYILWVDYGLEGWHPSSFEHEADLVQWIVSGNTGGSPFVVTGPVMQMEFAPLDVQEAQ